MEPQLNVLVLAGTADARFVINALVEEPQISMLASLAGATNSPQELPVPVRTGGFGGADGLAKFCQSHGIDLILDITHPFARHISRNAMEAARLADIACLAFNRPAWDLAEGGRSFDSWQEMVAAVPTGERVFLAGGTASIDAFREREDIFLCARALNVATMPNSDTSIFINAMPHTAIEDEIELFQRYNISLLCCKNSGGEASAAKLKAAQKLNIPVWMLARRKQEKNVLHVSVHDKLDDMISAVKQISMQKNLARS